MKELEFSGSVEKTWEEKGMKFLFSSALML